MAHESTQGYCHRCQRHTLHVRDTYDVPHIFHLLIAFLTCGFWLAVWFLHVLVNAIEQSFRPFLCGTCGQPAGRIPQRSDRPMLTQQEAIDATWGPVPELPPPQRAQLDYRRKQAAEEARKMKAVGAVDRQIRRNHMREIRRGQWRRLDANIDAAIARAVGEENTILVAAIGGTIRVLAVALPLAGIVVIIWLLGGW